MEVWLNIEWPSAESISNQVENQYGWKFIIQEGNVQQVNGNDCGILMIAMIETDIFTSDDLNNSKESSHLDLSNIPCLRHELAINILRSINRKE